MVFVGEDASGNAISCEVSGTFKNTAGTVTLLGTAATLTPIGSAGLAGVVCTLVPSGATVVPTVLGIALTTITWYSFIEAYINPVA